MSSDNPDHSLQHEIQKVLEHVPPGTNPFTFIIKHLYEKGFPPTSIASDVVLKIFFSFHLLICFLCICILVLPFLHGKRGSFWVFKRLYISDSENLKAHSAPLYFPNSGMLMAISQFLGSTSTLFYIWMLHNSRSDTEYRAKSKPIMFISLMCDFEFLAYWVMAWNSLYTKLYSGASYATYLSSKRKCALPPSFYNLIFILFPIISISMDSYYLKLLLSSMSKHTNSWFDLLNDLKSSSITWEALMDPSISRAKHATLIGKFLSDANHSKDLTLVLLQNLNTVIRRFRHLCISWAIVLLITCIFFIYSLWSFLSLIYQSTKPKIPKSSDNIPGVNVTQNGSSCNTNFTEAEIPISPQKEMMKQKFIFLTFRSGVMVFAINITIIMALIGVIIPNTVITNSSWRSIMNWVPIISGSISSLPITYQCWCLCNDEDEINKSPHRNYTTTTTGLSLNPSRGNNISAFSAIQPNDAFSSELCIIVEEFPLGEMKTGHEKHNDHREKNTSAKFSNDRLFS